MGVAAARGIGLGVLLALLWAAPAAAGLVEEGPDRTQIDWTRGLLTAVGAAAADLRAPSPDVARVGAERQARERARVVLRARAEELVLADGTRVGDAAASPEVAARLERAVERSLDLAIDHASDGSVVLTSGLPLEAIRLAVRGPAPPPAEPEGITALIVEAEGAAKKGWLEAPVLGLTLALGDERYAGPTVFHRSRKAAAADPRAGERAVRVRAAAAAGGVVTLAGGADFDAARLAAARRAGALVILVVP